MPSGDSTGNLNFSRALRLLAVALLSLALCASIAPATAPAKSKRAKSCKTVTVKSKKTGKKIRKRVCKKVKKHKAHATVKPNSGLPGSRCVAMPYPGAIGGGDPTVDTTSLGPSAPAPYEIGRPTGHYAGQQGRRVMMLIHGGGWYVVGREALAAERPLADAWRAKGWITVNADYRACGQSVEDVMRLYDLVRQKVGSSMPICLQGESAGGQLALMVAAEKPDVACVTVAGAPTDLAALAAQGADESSAPDGAPNIAKGSNLTQGFATAAFGARNLAANSPITNGGRIRARVLITTAHTDSLVPHEQAEELARAMHDANAGAYVDVQRLEAGSLPFVHGSISQAASDYIAQRLQLLVDPIVKKTSTLTDLLYGGGSPLSNLFNFGFFR